MREPLAVERVAVAARCASAARSGRCRARRPARRPPTPARTCRSASPGARMKVLGSMSSVTVLLADQDVRAPRRGGATATSPASGPPPTRPICEHAGVDQRGQRAVPLSAERDPLHRRRAPADRPVDALAGQHHPHGRPGHPRRQRGEDRARPDQTLAAEPAADVRRRSPARRPRERRTAARGGSATSRCSVCASWTVSRSPSHTAVVACGSSALWLCGGVVNRRSTDDRRRRERRSASPFWPRPASAGCSSRRGVATRRRRSPPSRAAPRTATRTSRAAACAASSVSATTTATGWPFQCTSSVLR